MIMTDISHSYDWREKLHVTFGTEQYRNRINVAKIDYRTFWNTIIVPGRIRIPFEEHKT